MKKTFRLTGYLRKRVDELNLISNSKEEKDSGEGGQTCRFVLLGVNCRGDGRESQAPNSPFPLYVFLRIQSFFCAYSFWVNWFGNEWTFGRRIRQLNPIPRPLIPTQKKITNGFGIFR